MNDATIFDKTAAGDEAIREKTRLVQRNLRLVLVLVNGIADVASLKHSLGDPAMVESALAELERLGLIESEEACAKRLAQQEQTATRVVAVPDEQPLVEAQTVFDEELATQVRLTPVVVPRSDDDTPRSSPLAAIPNWIEGLRKSRARAQEEALYERAYGSEAMDRELVDPVSIDPSMAPPLPTTRPRINPGSLIKGGLLVLVIGLVAAVAFYPYDNYRPEFEQRLAAITNDSVKIGALRVAFMPPAVVLENVTLGNPVYAEAAAIRLLPDASFPFAGANFRKAEIDGLRMQEAILPRLSQWFAPSAMGEARIGEISFEHASLTVAGHALTDLAGKAEPSNGVGRVVVQAAGGKLVAEISPTPAGVSVNATAQSWRVPFRPGFECTRMDIHGDLSPGRFDIRDMGIMFYDGTLSGSGGLAWTGSSARVDLKAEFQHLASSRLLSGIGATPLVDGEASGQLSVQGRAAAVDLLDRVAHLDSTFKVLHGTLRLDLVEAMRSKSAIRGGQMRFEEFAGNIGADAERIRLGNLRLSSGFLRGNGQATINRANGTMAGAVRLEMRSGAEGTQTTLSLDGTVDAPVLRATR